MDYQLFVEFAIPQRAVPKMRPRVVVKHGKSMTFTPRETRDWEEKVTWAAKAALRGRTPTALPVRVRMGFVGSRADIDNLAKSCLDAINRVCFLDDRQVERLVVTKQPKGDPSVVIAVDEIIEGDQS